MEPENELSLILTDYSFKRYRYQLRTTIFPSIMAKPIYKNKKIINYEGIDPNLLNLLAEKLNFTTVINKL